MIPNVDDSFRKEVLPQIVCHTALFQLQKWPLVRLALFSSKKYQIQLLIIHDTSYTLRSDRLSDVCLQVSTNSEILTWIHTVVHSIPVSYEWSVVGFFLKVSYPFDSVGTGCNIVRLQEQLQRRHRQAKPMRSSALSIAPSARAKAIHSINKRDKRARHVIPYFPTVITFHVKHATQHLHQNCLYTITSSYRHLANSYTLLLNDSITYTICWPGVEFSYTSICLSFGNSLYVIYSDGWTHTVTPEYINLPHTLSAYSSWSVHIFTYSISENDRYLPLSSIPGAGNTIAVADPAVIMNFRL